MAVTGSPKKGVQSPTPIGGLDFLDMDSLLKYPEITVLDFLDTPPMNPLPSGQRTIQPPSVQRAPRLM